MKRYPFAPGAVDASGERLRRPVNWVRMSLIAMLLSGFSGFVLGLLVQLLHRGCML